MATNPCSGCYLLIIISKPHNDIQKQHIVQNVAKGKWKMILIKLEKKMICLQKELILHLINKFTLFIQFLNKLLLLTMQIMY